MRKPAIVIGVLTVVAAVAVVLSLEQGSAPGFVLFLGRFHPLVVHFPIALLLVAILIEAFSARSERVASVRGAVPFILLIGAISALASVVLGYLLSLAGGYEEGVLSLHMWLGLAVTALACVLVVLSSVSSVSERLFRGCLYTLGILVIVAGHFGGTLARGSGYITYYLPETLKHWVGIDNARTAGLIANVDSALVYADLIQPVLNRRCVKCHGAEKSRGDLRLDTPEGLERGGRDGIVLVAGSPSQSEILRRITLPPYDEDVMPPDGEPPLDVGETELIRWWIQNGASFDARAADLGENPSAVGTYLARIAAPREPARSGIYALDVPFADTTVIAELRRAGLSISHAAADAPFLFISASSLRDRFTDTELERLAHVASQVARLDVGHTSVTTEGLAVVRGMSHLTHLHLETTSIDDDALVYLRDLEHLEYLNLYGTAVTDKGMDHLSDLASLRSVYVWQTAVTESGADRLQSAIPGIHINMGAELASVHADSILTDIQ